jgi:putative phosphoesterase
MTPYKVGVIADTHVPEFLAELPQEVLRLFEGVDLILHAGDITEMIVLDTLRTIAPVVAVKGDHDALNDLPRKTVIEIGNKRIGLIHGRRPRWQELPSIISNEAFPHHTFYWGGFHTQVLHKFEQVDAIVFGHFHRPYIGRHQGVLLFNPGAVYHLTSERAQVQLTQKQPFLRRLYLLNARRRLPIAPSVGLLTLEDDTIKAEILPLAQ